MAPTVKQGDLVAVVPEARYRGEGLYVIDVVGEPNIVRVHVDGCGRLNIGYDNSFYLGGPVAQGAFEKLVLGKVFAVVVVTDRAAMERAGMLDGEHADSAFGVALRVGSLEA